MDPVVIIVLVVFVFLVVGVPLIRTERRRIRDARSEETRVRARVVSKRIGSENIRHAYHTRDGGNVHHATFRLVGGEEMEFDLSRKEYGLLEENTWGELTYQGERFLSFKPLPGFEE